MTYTWQRFESVLEDLRILSQKIPNDNNHREALSEGLNFIQSFARAERERKTHAQNQLLALRQEDSQLRTTLASRLQQIKELEKEIDTIDALEGTIQRLNNDLSQGHTKLMMSKWAKLSCRLIDRDKYTTRSSLLLTELRAVDKKCTAKENAIQQAMHFGAEHVESHVQTRENAIHLFRWIYIKSALERRELNLQLQQLQNQNSLLEAIVASQTQRVTTTQMHVVRGGRVEIGTQTSAEPISTVIPLVSAAGGLPSVPLPSLKQLLVMYGGYELSAPAIGVPLPYRPIAWTFCKIKNWNAEPVKQSPKSSVPNTLYPKMHSVNDYKTAVSIETVPTYKPSLPLIVPVES